MDGRRPDAAGARRGAHRRQRSRGGGYAFDLAYTSVLKRAIRTLWIVLDDMDLMWIPVHRDWRLNETALRRAPGARTRPETAAKYGERPGEDLAPELRDAAARRSAGRRPRFPGRTRATRTLAPPICPSRSRSSDTVERFLPAWHGSIAPLVAGRKEGRSIAAHGNSLRALVKYLDGVSDEAIVELNIPTGIPLVYELDGELEADPALLSRRRSRP